MVQNTKKCFFIYTLPGVAQSHQRLVCDTSQSSSSRDRPGGGGGRGWSTRKIYWYGVGAPDLPLGKYTGTFRGGEGALGKYTGRGRGCLSCWHSPKKRVLSAGTTRKRGVSGAGTTQKREGVL